MNSTIRILVVDDDADVVRATCRLLEQAGYVVHSASTGAQVLPALREQPAHLVLLDRRLPDVDGLEICRQIKADPVLSDTFVVIASGEYKGSDNRAEGLEAQADGYIERPIGNRELLARVEVFVRILRLHRSLTSQAEQLQRKNEELERFNRLAVGREVRMVELKQEMLECCRRHGETAPYWLNSPPAETGPDSLAPSTLAPGALQMATVNLLEDALLAHQAAERVSEDLRQEIAERKRVEQVQAFLARTSTGTAGEPFFELLARYLAQSLGMDFVRIGRLEGDGLHARTLAAWCDGKFEASATYALSGTPCGEVVGKAVLCFPANVRQLFPRDQALQDLPAESYVGVTLWSHTGQPIGLIAASGRRPLTQPKQAEATLQLVAERVAGELEREQVEAALRASEVQHRDILQAALEGFVLCDPQGRLLQVNDAYCQMTGYAESELLGMRITDLEALEPPEATADRVQAILARGQERFESRHRRKNGSVFEVEVSAQYQPADNGRLVVFLRDITERKRAEQALRESEQRYRMLIEGMPGIVYEFSTQRGGVYYSSHVKRVLGWSAEDLYAQPLLWQNSIHPEDFERVRASIHGATAGEPFRIEYRIRDDQGHWHWFDDCSLGFHTNETGLVIKGLAMDITERKAKEERPRS